MRGRLTDFTVLEPVAPVAVRVLPADFDPRGHDDFLDSPRAAELAECDRCDWRTCNRLIRAEGRTVRPDCAAFLVMDGPTAPPAPSVIERAMSILRAEGPQTLQDLAARLDMRYFALRHYTERLLAAGCIVCVALRGVGRAKVYAATDAPLPAPQPVTHRKAAQKAVASGGRILDLLRARGPMAVRDLATETGLHATTVLDRLKVLEAAGQARQGGTETRVAEGFHNRKYKAQLWEATND